MKERNKKFFEQVHEFMYHHQNYGKTGHNRPSESVGYEQYRSVISLKPTDMVGQLNPGRLCELVVFNS